MDVHHLHIADYHDAQMLHFPICLVAQERLVKRETRAAISCVQCLSRHQLAG